MKKFLLLLLSGLLLIVFNSNAQELTGVSTSAASNITNEGAQLNGTLTTSSAIDVDYYFNYGTTSGSLTTQAPATAATVNVSSSQSVNVNLTGLSPETQYFYELFGVDATEATNNLTSSPEGSFFTYSNVTSTAVAGFQRQSATTASITLEWTAQTGDITGYLIVYDESGSAPDETALQPGTAPWALSYTDSVVVNDPTTTEVEITQFNGSALTPNTQYSFRIIPFNRGSNDATTNYKLTGNTTLSAYTLEVVTSQAIADFGVASKGNNNIELEWTAETTNNDGYLILWATGPTAPDPAAEIELGVVPGSQTFTNKIVTTGSASTSQDITSLTAGIEYSFVIIPYNTGADASTTNYNVTTNSEVSTFTLADEPNDNAGSPSFISSTSNSITLEFAKSDGTTAADGYFITYRIGTSAPGNPGAIDGTDGSSELAEADVDGTFTILSTDATISATIPGLSPGTEYSFRIIAFSSDATNNPSSFNYKTNGITFQNGNYFTLATEPAAAVSNFTKTSATESAINFTFNEYTTFADNGGFVLYYQAGSAAPDLSNLENGLQPSEQTNAAITSLSYTVQNTDDATSVSTSGNIDPGQEYSVILVPFNFVTGNFETVNYGKAVAESIMSVWSLAEAASGGEVANTGYTVDNATSNSLDVTYTAVTNAGGYLILYSAGNSAFDISDVVDGQSPAEIQAALPGGVALSDNGTALTGTIGSLNSDTEYAFYVIPYTFTDNGGPVSQTYNYNTTSPVLKSGTTLCDGGPAAGTASIDNDAGSLTTTSVKTDLTNVPVGAENLVIARLSADALVAPVDGVTYSANAVFGSGAQTGAGNDVVLSGTGTSVTTTSLSPFTAYSFDYYVYNPNGDCYTFVETIQVTTPCDPATTTVTGTSTSASSFDEITVNWTIDGGGNNVLVVARENTDAAVAPTLNTNYAEDPIFGSGGTTGTGNFTVYDGSGSSVTVTGLSELTNYSFDIYEYNPTNGGFCYNLNDLAVTETVATDCQPPSTTATFNAATNLTAGSVTLNWNTATGADSYLIVAKQGATVDLTVENADDYTGIANSNFSDINNEAATGNMIVYSTAGTSATITGLAAGTEYTFEIYGYVNSSFCYAFGPDAQTITTLASSSNNTLSLNSAAGSISSVDNDQNGAYISVMDFTMTDGGVDGIGTKISGYTFSPGTGNDFGDWTDLIQDAKVVNVTNSNEKVALSITATEISIVIGSSENNGSGKFGFIGDNASVNLQLQIRLKDNIPSIVIDEKNLVFELDPATITYQGNSSTFITVSGSEITTGTTENLIQVLATAFEFTADPPSTVNAGENVTPQAIVQAKDVNGNLDLGYGNFTISNAGTIPMDNLPAPPSFTNGEFVFPATFNYQGSGDGTLTLTDGGSLFDVTSTSVMVNPTVDLTELTSGLNSGTLQSGTTDQAVLGFAIDALGSTQVTSIEFTTDPDISGLASNLRIVASTNTAYEGTGTDSPIASTPTITGSSTITFSGLTESFSSVTKNYFLILDVNETVNVDVPTLTFGLDIADIVFTNSANKNASSFSKPYGFEDITKPEITLITATPTLLSGADLGTDALEIQVTFSEEMDPNSSFLPAISFPVEDPITSNSLTGPNGNGGWSAGNTVYTFLFDLSDQDELVQNIDVLISNARDKYGNILDDFTEMDLFTIDTENPKAAPINLDVASINRLDNTIELEITFDKVMNNTVAPDFSFNGTTEMSNNGDGVWSGGDLVYTITFDHSLVEEEVSIVNISITNAEDAAGNIMEPATSGDFSINTTIPRIDFITATNATGIYKADDVISIQVHFDQDVTVDDALGTPELDLNSGGTAVFDNAANNIVTFNYTVLATENASLLDVTGFRLEAATIKNGGLNEAILTLPAAAADELSTRKEIEIDTQDPQITSTSITPNTVSRVSPTLTLIVNYNEVMDQTSTPSFLPSDANIILQTGEWSDNQTYRAEFKHDLTVEEEVANVAIEISDATDSVGNTTVTADSETFNIDSQHPRITEIVTTTADGTYGPGEQINIRVIFDESIKQTGTAPTLTLNTGATAEFDNITGLNQDQLNFTYTIGAVNSNQNTLDLEVSSISTSESEVLDMVDNPSVLTLPANPNRLIDNSDIVIDTRPAEIADVTATNVDGKYKEGDIISLLMTFDEVVTVTNTPRIVLNTGDYANYVSGSNSMELTFNYTVQNSDGTTLFDVADLEYTDVNSLELNGGSIIDPASVPVDQALPIIGSGNSLGDNKNIEIDTRSPEFTIDLSTSMVDLNGLTLTVTTTYDEAMDINSDPSYTFSQGVNLLQDNAGIWTNNTTYVETFTHNETEEELTGITIEISGATDEVGNTAITNTTTANPFDIDTQKPRITEVNSTSSGIFGPGGTIDITVIFDEDVQKIGTNPTLNLNSTGVATFVDITNGNEVNFSYTVGTVNSGQNIGDLSVNSFSSSENAVVDLQENPSVLSLPAGNNLGDNANIIIDTDPADITNVTANPTSGVFKAGDVLDIIVTFNETVVVDETNGTPRLLLNTGSYATYSSGSNSAVLTFTYTVASAGGGIVDVPDLEYADINSLELNGGVIEDLASVNADLVLPATAGVGSLSANTNIEIDTTSPTVTIDLDNAVITRTNNQLALTATYNEDMDQGTTPNFNVQGSNDLILDGGNWNSATEYIATFTHNLTEEEVQNVTIEVSGGTDEVGNLSVTNASETFTIDTQKPRIVEIVSTSPDGLYSPGDAINIRLVFDEDVAVGGTPLLDLNSGGQASFQNITNGNQVNFVYTVGGVNSGDNTLDLDVTNFNMNGGNIRDLVSNDAEIVLPALPDRLQDNADIQVDSDPADIANVTASPDQGFFKTGDQISITIEFDEPVEVSGTGTPLLSLNTGSNAQYVSGSNSTVLTFNYIVEESDGTTILDVTDLQYANVNSIVLNGGTIQDLAGISASLGLPAVGSANSLSGNTDITIDTQDPELANNPFTPFNGEFNVSQSLTFTIELNEPVSGQGTNNITIIDKETSNVLVVLDGATAFTNNTSSTLQFDSFESQLQDSTEYYIQFDPGALIDRAGNEFAGFTADNFWSFTTFGPARIDDFSIGACVGEVFTIQGQYFTGVSRIRTNIDGGTPFTISTFTVLDDETIEFTVPAGTVPGNITLDKQSGQAGNTENASTTSVDPIKVGPSSAQIVLVDPNDEAICDIDDLENENEVEFTVDIVGGNGVYTLVYQVNTNDPVTITAYESGQTFSIIPPDSAQNNVRVVSLTDQDVDLNTCSAPDLGSDVEVIKYIRSKVDAGGFESEDSDIGIIELCGANTSILDFSDQSLVTNTPQITGTVQQGTWTIDEGPSSNGGGFSPDFTLKSVQTDRPDTVKYYASFADGVRGEITLKLTSDDPGGLNPCSGTNDLVAIRFVESISVNSERNIAICLEEDENGNQSAITDLISTVSGGSAADSLSAQWTRVDEFNEAADHDGTWGFKDDESQATYALTANVPNPIYKASPQEIQEGRSTLEVLPVLVSGIGCGAIPAPRQVNIRINDIPNPTKSSGPEIVCSGEQEVRFRMNTSRPGNTFEWNFTNSENEFDGATNSNLVFVNFREVLTETADTLVVQEFNPTTGCVSRPDTFYISLKPLPIANIKYNSTTTISNTAGLIALEGEGGVAGNLVDATSANGQFSGDGVIQNSNGNYFLDSSQLGVTDITDEDDVHEVVFTFTTEFGCSATDTIAFNVFDAERIFPSLLEEYCQLDQADTISVDNAIVPDGFIVSAINGPGITELGYTDVVVGTDTISILRVLFDPETAYASNGNQSAISITYSIEDPNNPANNAENVGEQIVIVNPLPELQIDAIEASLCSYDENLEFEPIGITGNNFSFELLNTGLPAGLMLGDSVEGFEFDPKPLVEYLNDIEQDSIRIFIKYTYRDENTCSDFRVYNFLVWRQPSKPVVNPNELCFVDGIMDIAEVQIVENSLSAKSNKELSWYSSLDFTVEPIATGPSFQPTPNFFATERERTFYVLRRNIDSQGEQLVPCASAFTEVTYRRIDNPEFDWNKSTFGNEDIVFTGQPNQTSLDTAEWTITRVEDGERVADNVFTQVNDTTVSVDFNSYGAGRYQVNFKVSTTESCSAEITKEIIVLPEAAVSDSYVYNFDGSTDGWVSTGSKLSPADPDDRLWDFDVPTGNSTFESTQAVWITNAEGSYESGIVSYVYSPSMDISGIERPVVSFDLWLNMAQGDDGLILEYSTDGKVVEDPEKRWGILGNVSGDVSSGLEWYNVIDIASRPGTNDLEGNPNNPAAAGWSLINDLESVEPVNAKHALEEIPMADRGSLVFRFQFKSRSSDNQFDNSDGAAFDNFRIESLNRNVLVEYFGGSEASANDEEEMDSIQNEFATTGNFAWINYRINENDPLYQQQSSPMLSRVYYYDAYDLSNQFAIDGELRDEDNKFSVAGASDLSRARLFKSISRIDLDITNASDDELEIDVSFQSVEPLGDNVNLYIAVLQKEISGGAQGTNPDVTYYNVLRKLLPGNSGVEVSGTGGQQIVNFKASRPSDENALAVVAFLQNTETGQVLQSAYSDEFAQLSLANVTAVEKGLTALDIKLFPNPAHDYLNINWTTPLQEEAKVKVIDVTGKIIKEFGLNKGQRYYELSTSSLKTGMYNLIMTNDQGEYKMMKFAVTN